MVNDYADGKIQDALKHAGGSQTQARKTLLEWALKDQMLLISLTQQHLGSIVAHAISKASAGNDGRIERAPRKKKQAPAMAKPVTVNIPPESFGKDLLKALSGRDSVRFGMESATGRPIVTARKKASQQHIDTLKKLSVVQSDTQPKSH